ncbi:MAG: right-handed parallel beta-helix repeat-containing protein [Verrucomicrobiae bacterium]|nr:right-handed parallel beta-helix repeat-containing protein [Verrucomicrobiae bacterium]
MKHTINPEMIQLTDLLHSSVRVAEKVSASGSEQLLRPGFFLGFVLLGLVVQTRNVLAAENVRRDLAVIIVTNDLVLEPGSRLNARLVIRSGHVTVDGRGTTLIGPGETGNPESCEHAGVGVSIEGVVGVTLRNLRAHGFLTGLVIRESQAVVVEQCDFSDNYHNPSHGWGELPPRGGILLINAQYCVVRNTRANRVWDGIHLVDSDDNMIVDNDFSRCSNTCAKLWRSSRNRFMYNNLSHGIRIDRAAGEVHARDSAGVLIETGSDDNYWYRNDITHGGDGVFIRPLNRWVSRGNVFVENDMSYANNNCVESWSPGNIFIRNKANHGSYGFWLGGSDHTVLIGNEAAFNGQTNGWHNAPEPGFGHGGIVIVGGPSSHTVIDGNHLHHNNGAGIAFRGDVASKGTLWRTEHWIIQRNRITDNKFGIWGMWGTAILMAANLMTNNTMGNYMEEVQNLIELAGTGIGATTPVARLAGPEVAIVGETVRFDASASGDASGSGLQYLWWLGNFVGNQSTFEHRFDLPGFYRIGLTVHNGEVAALAWRDLLVIDPVDHELGTEGDAANWGYDFDPENATGRIRFSNTSPALVGQRCLMFVVDPYPGDYATVVYPRTLDAGWNFDGKKEIVFWLKTRNPNIPGWQNAGPVIRLMGPQGKSEFTPGNSANLLNDPPYSEARWTWRRFQIPLSGNQDWVRTDTGNVNLGRITAISISLDSWGGEAFTVWIDGLAVR